MVSAGTSFAASDDGDSASLVSDDILSVENDNNDYLGNIVTSDDVLSDDNSGKNTHFSASDNVIYSHPNVIKNNATYVMFLSTSDIVPMPLKNKTVHVEFNGASSDYTTNNIGMVRYIIPSTTPAGEFNINMKFDGDENYTGSSLTTSIEIVNVETKFISLGNFSYSRPLIEEGLGIYPIALTTNGTIALPLANKTVIVDFDDVGEEFTTNNLGLIFYKISKNTPSGNYILKATYHGDEGYLSSEFATSIEIYDVGTQFIAPEYISYSHASVKERSATYPIALTTNSTVSLPLKNKTVHVEFNGKSRDYVTNSLGEIYYTIPSKTRAGEYELNMKFDGDSAYVGSSLTATIEIEDTETKFIALENISYPRPLVVGGLGYYPIILTTNSTVPTPLANRTIIVEFDGVGGEFTTNNLGLVNYKFYNSPAGNYTLKAVYYGDECYTSTTFTTTIEIFDVGSKFIAPKNMTYSYFKVADGSASVPMILAMNTTIPIPLANRSVYVEFNGIGDYYTTNRLGFIDYKLFESPAGNYTLTMNFEGDDYYNATTSTVNVEITKGDMVIFADYDSDANEIVATIINDYTRNPVTNVKMNVDINGVETTAKSNSKGQIKVSTADLPLGAYTAVISYAGNSKYNAAEGSVYFDVKTNMNITAAYDAYSDAIVATLTNRATGKAIANAKVNVDIDGVNYTVKTNSKGQAKVSTADLPSGTHTAIISYAGNSKYNPASTSINFDMKTKVMITDICGDSELLTATLTNSVTGKAVINAKMEVDINGVKTTVKSNSKGIIIVPTADLGLTSYTATISYPGNSKYSPSSATATIDLEKANMVITQTYDAEKQQMVATLKNSKTGKAVSNANMVVNLNGVKTTYKSDSKGQITFSTEDYAPGTYVGTISYAGNAKYNSISAAFKVDI